MLPIKRVRPLLLLAPLILVVLGATLYLPWARTQPVRIPYDRLPPPVYLPTREPGEQLPPANRALNQRVEALQQEFLDALAADLFGTPPTTNSSQFTVPQISNGFPLPNDPPVKINPDASQR